MALLDRFDRLVLEFKHINSSTAAVTTLLTLIGVFVVFLWFVKTLIAAYQGFRLYVVSQFLISNTKKYGEWAVITGAANGIGRAMARELARRGHSIVAIDIDKKNLAETKSLLEDEPKVGKVVTIIADLSDSSLENYAHIEQKLDLDTREIGVLINNAGIVTGKLMRYGRFEMEAIRNTVNVNILATAYMTRIVLPQMADRRKGLILNISSIAADLSMTYTGLYGSSKAFVSEFSRFLKLEYSQTHNVDVVCLTPSAVRTRMLTDFSESSLPSSIMVSPEYFARSALNALGAGISAYSGCWMHGLFKVATAFIMNLGLLQFLMNLFMGIKPRRRAPPSSTEDK